MTRIITLISLLLMLAACGTSRKTTATPATPGTEAPVEAAENATPRQLYASMTATYSPWQSLQMPVRASLRSPMSVSASGRLTMVRDSLVHLSLRMLGIELAVVSIDKDSVRVFDKFHRYYMAESTAALSGRTGITLADIQSLLLGRAFVPGRGPATASMARELSLTSAAPGTIAISPAGALPYSLEMQARRLANGHVALCGLNVAAGTRTAAFTITPCEALTRAGATASAIDISARLGTRSVSAALTFTPERAEWDTAPSLQLPSTRGYTHVNLATLLKSGF
ncbi:MAG: DUF4292 domain-containing protein [Muribaculaceae bacterium]|nr:DUF4292 domain-containing protein [Muribaculaceae bacterium]